MISSKELTSKLYYPHTDKYGDNIHPEYKPIVYPKDFIVIYLIDMIGHLIAHSNPSRNIS